MSLLKLDSEREKQARLLEIEQEEKLKTERANGSDTLAFLSFFAIAGLCVGYYMSDSRQTSTQIPTMIGTAIALILFSGVISLIALWLTGKWKLVFALVYCVLAGLSIASVILK